MQQFVMLEISDDSEFREWAKEIQTARYEEAVESLKREEVTQESVFLVELDGKKYLAFYMEGECKPSDPSMEINQKHKALMARIAQKRIKGELLYTVTNRV